MITIGDLAFEYRLAGPSAPETIWDALGIQASIWQWHEPLSAGQEQDYRRRLDAQYASRATRQPALFEAVS